MAPVAVPRVRLLGRPAVLGDASGWRELPPGQRAAALGYLALARRWVAREELVALFWPDRPEPTARGNLRPLLARLARDPLVVGLERERTRVRWSVESDHAAFVAAQREHRWDEAWRLAEAELLDGVTVSGAPEFESWLAIERAVLHDARREVGLRVADTLLEAGAHERAVEVLASLQRFDPLDEAVLRRLIVALARRGARGDALATYETFVERCLDELGAAPEAATSDLAEAVRRGEVGSVPERMSPKPRAKAASVVPVPLTPLVGRRGEVVELLAWLEDPECRLLTLVGPGGIGKTRLALEAARVAAPRYGDGVCVVDLAAVSSERAMVATVAAVVGAQFDATGEAALSIVRALASRELLLVLDNVEHLEGAPGLVSDLLHGAPGLQVVATSRKALGLAAEWRFDVKGLSHWTDQASGVDRARRVSTSDAAALFVSAARRASAAFAPGPHELDVIEGIGARLAGSPLAIELAAAWSRVIRVEVIDEELARGIDFLASDAADRSPRHASMQRVLDQSWAMLQPREQVAMRRLTVFRGGFTLDAARDVAGLEMPTLLALVNKSFLQRDDDGRFSLHPLVWRDACERADAHGAEVDAMRVHHAHYYLRLLAEHRDAHRRPDGGRMMRAIEVDFENVVVAWRRAVAEGAHDLPLAAVVCLGAFRHARGHHDVVEDLFREALTAAPSDGALHGLLLAGIGLSEAWAGRGDLGVAKLREGAALVEGRVDAVDWAWTLRGLGQALGRLGRDEEAASSFERAAALYRQVGDVDSELTVLKSLASRRTHRASEGLRARRALEARALELGATRVLWSLLGGIATHERLLGAFARAERAASSLRAYADDTERSSFQGFRSRNALAAAYLERGRLRRAEALACRTLRRPAFANARERFGDAVAIAAALVGRVALIRRDLAAAEAWSRRSLDRHRADHGPDAVFDFVLETLARTALAAGDDVAAAAWLEAVGRGPDPWWFEGRLIAEARRIGCRCCVAEVALHRGEIGSARAVLRDALDHASRAELIAAALWALVSSARLFRLVGEQARARSLLRYVRDHPRATFEARSAAAFEHDGRAATLMDAVDDGIGGVLGVASEVASALAPG